MNYPETDLTKSVASWEEIMRTGFEEDGETLREVPDLKHKVAVGGLDFASIKDFLRLVYYLNMVKIIYGKVIHLYVKDF